MNSDYFMTKILSHLEQAIFPRGRDAHRKRLVAHVDNCSIHISRASTSWLEEQGVRHIPRLPYSLDLASSDFYLFPPVKEKPEMIQIRQEDQDFECLQEILAVSIIMN
jgi:hypothetical protein